MTIHAHAYGRIFKIRATQTKAGQPMTILRVGVDVTGKDGPQQTFWLDALAFADQAEQLAKHAQGDMLGMSGRLTRSIYQANDGQERESWTLMLDSYVSARTVRPGSRRQGQDKGQAAKPSRADYGPSHRVQEPAGNLDFDDPINF